MFLFFTEALANSQERILLSATEPSYPPFSIVAKNNRSDGFSVDLLKSVAKVMGLEVQFKVGEWDVIKNELKSGQLDVLALMVRHPEREKDFDFTIPYFSSYRTVIIRKGDKRIKKVSDLGGKKLIVVKGGIGHEYLLETQLTPNIILTNTYEEALGLLANYNYDGVLIQKIVGIQLIERLNHSNLEPVNFILNDLRQDFCFAVKDGDKELLAQLNEGLSIVISNGTYERLYNKWFDFLNKESLLYKKISSIFIVLAALLLILSLLSFIWQKALKQKVEEKTRKLEENRTKEKAMQQDKVSNFEKTVESLVKLIEHRDNYTGGHSQRVATYSKMVAQEMNYSAVDCELIYRAGILHDIGKVTTPDAILLKPGRLSEDEFELIQSHVKTGADMLEKIPMYQDLSAIVRAHHERIDGTGYPAGLVGDAIPPLARIMAVCDAFDAMTTNRIYKACKTVSQALEELQSLIGIHYQEEVVMAANRALSQLKLADNTSQFPESKLEQQRFAFFFKDQVTNAFNEKYLTILLKRNKFDLQYCCLNVVFLKNFTQYNDCYGWKSGDDVLNEVSKVIQEQFLHSLVFRFHGDDFIIMCREHIEIDLAGLEKGAKLPEKEISLAHIHFHTENHEITTIEALENKIQEYQARQYNEK